MMGDQLDSKLPVEATKRGTPAVCLDGRRVTLPSGLVLTDAGDSVCQD